MRIRALGVVLGGVLLACAGGDGGGRWAAFNPGPVPPDLTRGERLYNSYCLSCHGRHGRGDGLGAPMLDSLFLAPLVPDTAFFVAVRQGANQKYYSFGAMPPLQRVSDAEVRAILGYVRWVQARAWPPPAGGNGS